MVDQDLGSLPYSCKGIIAMAANKFIHFALFIFLVFVVGCSGAGEDGIATPHTAGLAPTGAAALIPSATGVNLAADALPTPVFTQQPESSPQTASPTSTIPTPTETEVVFEVGEELTIEYLRGLDITGSEITFEQELPQTFYYQQHLVSYLSEGYKIYGLLTIPMGNPRKVGLRRSFSITGISRRPRTAPRNATPPTLIIWLGAVLWSLRSITAAMGSRRASRPGRTSRRATPSMRSPRSRACKRWTSSIPRGSGCGVTAWPAIWSYGRCSSSRISKRG